MHGKDIAAVLKAHSGELLSVTGVVGVGEGECDGRLCIKVFVTQKSSLTLKLIPSTLEGFKVAIEETGEFKACK